MLRFLNPANGVKTANPSRFQDVTSGNVLRCFLNLISVSHTDMFEILKYALFVIQNLIFKKTSNPSVPP